MPTRDERRAENQYRFSNVNDRLRELVEDDVKPDQKIPFLCECADDTCLARVELELQEYEVLHPDDSIFVIVPGHARVDGEVLLERGETFEQVRKGGQ